jgi:3',5'-cyclic AMP phosphodiesterase CpdA
MTKPTVLVQLTDSHIGAVWSEGDPIAGLRAAIAAIGHLDVAPDAILFSGDLAEAGAEAEYELVLESLQGIGVPVHVLAGNHDDRAAMRRCFGLPGAAEAPIQHTADVGALRLVMVDTTRPGEDRGELDSSRLEWLDGELAAAPDRPTLLAMHHPPIATGSPVWDAIDLPGESRSALAEVLARHPQVLGIVAGHHHQMIVAELGSRPVTVIPSTYGQARVGLGASKIVFGEAVSAFAVHVLVDGVLASYVQFVPYR